MRLLSRKTMLILAAVAVLGLTLAVAADFTDACRLEQVSLDGQPLDDWQERFTMLQPESHLDQPLDSLAGLLLRKPDVFRVDLSYSTLHTLEVRTNRFTPACFVLEESTGRLRGLDSRARLVPLHFPLDNWEHPVFTRARTGEMFAQCKDGRVELMVRQLGTLRDKHRDLYRLIDEIDFGYDGYLEVTVSGLPYHLQVRAETFPADMDRFVEFVTSFGPDLRGVSIVDLRFNSMVICTGGKT
ncbi:MAG: hypothetical protein KAU35_09950 [candidate division Zixibacteria bacterium]|nr:hypothetical protein [candidate division Zixibacteria bacterium]